MKEQQIQDTLNNLQKLLTDISTSLPRNGSGDQEAKFQEENPDVSPIENVSPLYARNGIDIPTIYRFNQSGLRYYFTYNEATDDIDFYSSVTTQIERATPLSYGLKKLIGELGISGFYKMMKEKAHYGTILHILIADYLRTNGFDFDSINSRIRAYFREHKLDYDVDDWAWRMKKDLLSLIAFCVEHDVEPLIIEGTGTWVDETNPQIRVAGTADIVCNMDVDVKDYWGEVYKSGPKKGTQKLTNKTIRVNAVVDFKSGKAGFFEDHEIQLHMYKMIVKHSYGIPVDRVFNVAPADWRDKPTYKLKDQTESKAAEKIPFIMQQFAVEWDEPKDMLVIGGNLTGENIDDVCQWVSAKEYIVSKLKAKMSEAAVKPTPRKNGRKRAVQSKPATKTKVIKKTNKKAVEEMAEVLNI